MIATPARASCRTTLNKVSHSDVERADVGSSMIKIRASSDNALAISTNCCSPILSSAMRLCSVDNDAEPLQKPASGLHDATTVDDSTEDQWLAAEKDVVGRGQLGNQVEFLVDDRDARALGVLNARETNVRTLDPDLAVIVDVHAREDLHQCRFARAVLPH